MTPTEFTARKLALQDAMMRDRDLSPLVKVVGALLLSHVNSEMGYAWPSISRLANEANCSERSAQYAVRSLIAQGWFTIVPGSGGGRRMTNRYVPNLEKVQKKGATDCTVSVGVGVGDGDGVQTDAKTVQTVAQNGATGCTRIPYQNPSTITLERRAGARVAADDGRQGVRPNGASNPIGSAHGSAKVARQVVQASPSSSPHQRHSGTSATIRTLTANLGRRWDAQKNTAEEIVGRCVSALRLERGEAWRLLMAMDVDVLSNLERAQDEGALSLDMLAEALMEADRRAQASAPA